MKVTERISKLRELMEENILICTSYRQRTITRANMLVNISKQENLLQDLQVLQEQL